MAQYDREVPYPEGPDQINAYPALSQELAAAINALTPVGTIIQCVTQPAAGGWILCDGGMYSRSEIGPELYLALYQYWAIGGVVVPNGDPMPVPDLRGRVVIGAGNDGHDSNNVDRPIGRRGGDTRIQQHSHSHQAFDPGSSGVWGFIPSSATGNLNAAMGGNVAGWIAPSFPAGASGNVPPYAVIPSFIYAGKPGPFAKVGDIKDTYPVPDPSPVTTLDIAEGEIPVAPDVENNPPDGYWEANNG